MVDNKLFSRLKNEMSSELDIILNYWMDKTIDNENGGFYGQIDGRNHLRKESGKGAVLNARILWTFSSAYRILKNQKYLDAASRAKDYLLKYFVDKEFGGIYWMLDYIGNPIETKKQIYAQSFAMYGLSEYYKITKDKEALEYAIKLFELTEKYSYDKIRDGYFEAYSREWVLLEDLRLSDKDANEKKTMNTHLHVMEGYANLYRVWPDAHLKQQLTKIIHVFCDKIIDNRSYSFKLFFDENWNCKSKVTSFGHDIEGSWLLLEAAEVLGDHSLVNKIKDIALKMADKVACNGLDSDGALVNEGEDCEIVDYDKHWWPQTEAIVGFINAWAISGNEEFMDRALAVWDFTKEYIIDHEYGEWYFRVNRDGVPYLEEDKVGPWKCPYHNSRACFEIIERFNALYKN